MSEPSSPEILIRVTASNFVAGFVIDLATGRCVEAAPILRRHLLGKPTQELRKIVKAKRWAVEKIGESEERTTCQ